MNAGLLVGAFLTSVLSGFVPLVNGEVVAVTAALLMSRHALPPLLVACVGGQMLAKIALYVIARWSPRHLPDRAHAALARGRLLARGRRRRALLVFTSAGVGLPPFYLVTVVAGALQMPFASYVGAGTAGTLVRYAVLLWSASRIAGP